MSIEIECRDCRGSGVYPRLGDRAGLGYPCKTCRATGKEKLDLKPFNKRRHREGIKEVVIATNEDTGEKKIVSYEYFQKNIPKVIPIPKGYKKSRKK